MTTCLAKQDLDQEYEVLVVNDDGIDRSTARNRGIERANAEIVALTDDDCEPPSDWLSSIVRAFAATDDLVCLEGPVTGGSTYTGTRHYVGCNLAVRRDAALSVGGFDSRYAGWREDTEFGWRMERQPRERVHTAQKCGCVTRQCRAVRSTDGANDCSRRNTRNATTKSSTRIRHDALSVGASGRSHPPHQRTQKPAATISTGRTIMTKLIT